MSVRIKRKEREAIIRSLRAGVVPRVGLHHIQVGRKTEVGAVLEDLEYVKEGGAAIRFVVGRFGSGKSFFLNLASTVALEQGFLVARADVTTDRRLHGSKGQARGLYTELMNNLSSKSRPEGGALAALVERWLSDLEHGGQGDAASVETRAQAALRPLQDLVSGFDFAKVMAHYFRGFAAHDDGARDAALRWLRAEYGTKTEARKDLGVRVIIDDADIYDYLKLMARFARLAGYAGLLVTIDELVVLSHRLPSKQARNSNYEAILRILNDCLQGQVEGLMVMFGATDDCLEDKRRGLFSYEALATRLAPNEFAIDGRDLLSPVVKLDSLAPEDMFVLLHRIRHVFAAGDATKHLIPDEGLTAFLEYSSRTLGAEYFKTPRDTVTRFVALLGVLEADPTHDWRRALGTVDRVEVPSNRSAEAGSQSASGDSELVSFKL